jgi:hypothetical protein
MSENNETNTSSGFGDTVAKIAETLKLDKVVHKLSELSGKKDCGCKKRQQKLNDMFPYKK